MTHLATALAVVLLSQAEPEETNAPHDPLTVLQSALVEAIAKAEPSVVAITRTRTEDGTTLAVVGRHDQPDDLPPGALLPDGFDELGSPDYLPLPGDFGSGVVIGENGKVLTAFHVVQGARGFTSGPRGESPSMPRFSPPTRAVTWRSSSPPQGASARNRWNSPPCPSEMPTPCGRGRSCSPWATRITPRETAGRRRGGESCPTPRDVSRRRPTAVRKCDRCSDINQPCCNSTPSSTWA